MISVYVKINSDGFITDINSSIFIRDTTNWTKIDEGNGDKFALAQGNYLPKPVRDKHGYFNYKLVDGEIVEIS